MMMKANDNHKYKENQMNDMIEKRITKTPSSRCAITC